MKKFNVPTQMDVILQLISGKNRKPHLCRVRQEWWAVYKLNGMRRTVRYSNGQIRVCTSGHLRGRNFLVSNIGFADCLAWAKRVDANRHKWDK